MKVGKIARAYILYEEEEEMRTKKEAKMLLKKAVMSLVMMCVMLSMSITAFATEGSSADPRDSVLRLVLAYVGDDGTRIDYQAGTCFLINDEYVITNNHVVNVDDAVLTAMQQNFQLAEKPAANDPHIRLFLMVNNDMSIEATKHSNVFSEQMDFAAVKLSEKIYDRTPIALGDSDQVQVKDEVFAVGFPANSISTKDWNTSEDVSTVDGIISKLTEMHSADIFEHTAPLNYGNSGGPLLNDANEVIAINTGGIAIDAEQKNYSIQINQVKSALDTFGIAYSTSAGQMVSNDVNEEDKTDSNGAEDTTEEDTTDLLKNQLQSAINSAEALDTENSTEESVKILTDSISAGKGLVANDAATETELQTAIDNINTASTNLEEKPSTNIFLIVGIVAGVVVVVIIVVVVVVSNGKKKNKSQQRPMASTPMGGVPTPGTPMNGAPMGGMQTPAQPMPAAPMPPTDVLGAVGETSLLSAGETTLLSNNSAYMIRVKNGERISVNLPRFTIGRERSKVNYCVADNTSISRNHAAIVKKGADYYVVDQGAANLSFLNGTQLVPNKETLLKDRDKIKLAEEVFEFYIQ